MNGMIFGKDGFYRSWLLLAVALLVSGRQAGAEEPTEGVDIALVSSVRSVAPSATFTVGLTIHHHEGFHTYWKNPGAVGYPIQMKWELPEGFKAGEIRWPVPEMSSMAGHPVFGYERDVTLLVDLTAPVQLPEGELDFHADVSWMACSDSCHPDSRRFTVKIPCSEKTETNVELEELFSKAEKRTPGELEGWEAVVETPMDDAWISIVLTAASSEAKTGGEFRFYSEDGQVSSDPAPRITKLEDGKYRVDMERAQFSPKGSKAVPFVLVGEDEEWFGRLEPEYPRG